MRCFRSLSLLWLPFCISLMGGCQGSTPNEQSSSGGSKTKTNSGGGASQGGEGSPSEDPDKDSPSKKKEQSPKGEEDSGEGGKSGNSGVTFDLGALPEPGGDSKRRCDIDFLFVIDNSGSMGDIQKSIAASVPDFIKTVQEGIPDLESYHIGVISTDEGFFNSTPDNDKCKTLGGLTIHTTDLARRPASVTCTPYANGKNFMVNEDDLKDKFKCASELGANGNGNERPMDAMLASLGDDLTKKGGCNEGFFRDDAILVVVLITDEEDDPRIADNGNPGGSKGDPDDWYKALRAFKQDRPEYLVMLSMVGIPEPNQCDETFQPGSSDDGKGPKTAEIGERLIAFTKKFGKYGVVGDVCADNFDPFFRDALSALTLACEGIPR